MCMCARDTMLRLGGSAVDVSIATITCIGAVQSQSCGIGGGHFSTIYDRSHLLLLSRAVLGLERNCSTKFN